MLAWLLSLPRALRRRPRATLAAALVVAVMSIAATLIGRQIWAYHHFNAAQADIKRWKFADAYTHLQPCLDVWPNDPSTHFLAARTARRAKRYEDAKHHLERYRELSGLTDDYNLELAMFQVQQGDMSPSEDFLRSHVGPDHPDAALALEAMAQGLLDNGRYATLIECADLWLTVKPEETHALYYKGLAFELLGNYEKARESYQWSVLADPSNWMSNARLGDLLLNHFDLPKEALYHFTCALSEEPGNQFVRLGMARTRHQLGDRDEARRLFDELLVEYPNMALALAERGKIALQDGDPERAEAWLRKSVEHAPGDKETLFTLIGCLEELKKDEEARAFRAAFKKLERDLKRMDELLRERAKAPNNANLNAELAEIYFRYNREEDGIRCLDLALQADRNHIEANRVLLEYRQKHTAVRNPFVR